MALFSPQKNPVGWAMTGVGSSSGNHVPFLGNVGRLWVSGWARLGCGKAPYSDLMGFYRDSMGFYSDLMGY